MTPIFHTLNNLIIRHIPRLPLFVFLASLFLIVAINQHAHIRLTNFILPLVELWLAFYALSYMSIKMPRLTNICYFLISAIFVLQLMAWYISSSFIGSLAIENYHNSWSIQTYYFLLLVFIFIIVGVLIFFNNQNSVLVNGHKFFWIFAIGFFILAFNKTSSSNHGMLKKYDVPLVGFVKNIGGLAINHLHQQSRCLFSSKQEQSSLSSWSDQIVQSKQNPKNVIIIFVEGLSQKLIVANTETINLPHLRELSEKFLSFRNYYNHTAATYRGLLGSLTSSYLEFGGKEKGGWEDGDHKEILAKKDRESLIKVLNQYQYQTYFISPHDTEEPLNYALASLGFDRVLTKSEIIKNNSNICLSKITDKVSDQGIFDTVLNTVSSFENKQTPFFIAAYNAGTHAFTDADNCSFKKFSSNNQVKNRFENFDFYLGNLVDQLNKLGNFKDTMIVVTSDHATYPDAHYRQLIGAKKDNVYFVDTIPLIVINNNIDKLNIDAQGKNSMSLVPTLLDLLDFKYPRNMFDYPSLVNLENSKSGQNISAIGYDFFLTTDSYVYSSDKVPRIFKSQFKQKIESIKMQYRKDYSCELD